MDDADTKALQKLAKEAEILHAAGEIMEALSDTADEMELDGEGTPAEDLQTATDTCKKLSMTMTATLAKHGHVPDFDTFDEDDDEDDGPSMYH